MLPIAKLRRRKRPSGSIGWSVRASQAMKPANRAAPIVSVRKTAGSPQPRSGCSISPKVIPARPSAHSVAPTTSTRAFGSRSRPSGTARNTMKSVSRTIGMLIAKIQRHDAVSTSWPPISGPSTVPIPPQAVQAPTALPRSSGGNTATITASAAGVRSAPETPCSARATTSISIVGASAHSSEVTPNPATPTTNMRRSPNRSPSEPPIRSSELSVTR